ncbi:zinc-dependent alcohol dehydrogenase [Tistrella sp. BH-R2-4]|uniref:alcohol dehydrogenase n=1 Tax=Tistrella arctica TaxID=3133430 RepID=A0ABU9YNY5_9PROT
MTMMRAAILDQPGQGLRFRQIARPVPAAGEVLIRVAACGVCHSDLHIVDGDWGTPPLLPLIPGHEVTGHVVALGSGVSGLAIGDAAGVPWMAHACGRCGFCLAGMETICPEGGATGFSRHGGYAEYMVAEADFVARLPAGADLAALAPVLCAGVTTYRGLKRSEARPGQMVAVIGVGGLGHVAVQYARAMGLRPVAVDVSADRLAQAHRLGAERMIDAAGPDPVAALIAATGGGVHAALVTATAPRAFEQALAMVRPGGTVVFIGLPGGDRDTIRVSISAISNWERSIRGSNVGTRTDLQEAVDFALRGHVRADIETMAFDDIDTALARLRAGMVNGRLVLTMP